MTHSSKFGYASDMLTVVNGSKEYKISRQLICSKIPYFDNMCSSKWKESVDGKVVLDLDDKAFESLIHWARSGIIDLNMPNVIRLFDCADYLLIDKMKNLCLDFFWNYFDVRYTWPNGLSGASGSSGCLSQQLFSFLSRSFNIIKASPTFTELPFEVVHYLCKVDACVKSEREIFDAFKRWIENKKNNATEDKLNLLLETIRWPYVSPDDLAYIKNGYKSLGGNEKRFAKTSSCKLRDLRDRRVENHLVAIFFVADDKIELFYFCDPVWTSLGVYKQDDSLSSCLYSGHKVNTDIIYESGRKGIRIDWLNKKYRHLEIMGSPSPYYEQLFRHFAFLKEPESGLGYTNANNPFFKRNASSSPNTTALLNYNGKFCHVFINDVIEHEPSYKTLMNFNFGDLTCLAARNSRRVFVISKNTPTFLRIYEPGNRNCETETIRGKTVFNDLELTYHNEEIYVTKKSSKEIFIYEPKNFECKLMLKHRIFIDAKLTIVASASIPKAFLSS